MDSQEVKVTNFEEPFEEESDSDSFQMTSISLDELKDLEHVQSNSLKPKYPKPVNLSIDKVGVSRSTKPKESKNGDKYFDYRVIIHYSDGNKEGLGGFRGYLEGNKVTKFWSTEKSSAGRVKRMLEDHMELKEALTFYQFVSNLQGQKVRVRTEEGTIQSSGAKYSKNMPIEFLSSVDGNQT